MWSKGFSWQGRGGGGRHQTSFCRSISLPVVPREAKPTDPSGHVEGSRAPSRLCQVAWRGFAGIQGKAQAITLAQHTDQQGPPRQGIQSSTEKAVLSKLLDNRQIKLDKADTHLQAGATPSYPAPAPGSCPPDPHGAPPAPDEGREGRQPPMSSQELKCPYWWSEQPLKGSGMFSPATCLKAKLWECCLSSQGQRRQRQ